jgi:hypothetical protein
MGKVCSWTEKIKSLETVGVVRDNAVIVHVPIRQFSMSGNATYQALEFCHLKYTGIAFCIRPFPNDLDHTDH